MNSNWSRLKRKLNENKQNTSNRHKRRRLTPPNSSTTNSKNSKSSNHHNSSKTNNNNNKSFFKRYLNSSSNPNTIITTQSQNYRNNTSKKQLYSPINLIPPQSTNNDLEQRKAFWNDLRLKLRARLPKEFLFKIITPISHAQNKSFKLHEIKPNTKHTNVMALDCEMVGIGHHGNKSILARISIVNFFGEVVYDKFVQPKNDPTCSKVTDYREDITGITRQDLVKYGITFEQCQKEIIQLLKGRKIVGHAIDNDFAVLKCANIFKKNFYSNIGEVTDENGEELSKRKMRKLLQRKGNENWFFDTAKCELLHDSISRPRSLKFLLELYLGIHIQSDEHDSVIDAISTMAIYRVVLPEIKEKSKGKVMKRREQVDKKRMKVMKKEAKNERRQAAQKNQLVMSNYAYDNELDRLMAQFDESKCGGGDVVSEKKIDSDVKDGLTLFLE